MIYLNQEQIIGLKGEILNLETKIEEIESQNNLDKDGGELTGTFSVNNLILNSGIKISGDYFYLDLYNKPKRKILIGDIAEGKETGILQIFSISQYFGNDFEAGIIAESETGNVFLHLGDSQKIQFSENLDFISKNKFQIDIGSEKLLYADSNKLEFGKSLKTSKLSIKDIDSFLLEEQGSSIIIDNFNMNDFYIRKYMIKIFTAESVQIKNFSIITKNTGIYSESTTNYSEFNSSYFSIEVSDTNTAYLKAENLTNKKLSIKGICWEFHK